MGKYKTKQENNPIDGVDNAKLTTAEKIEQRRTNNMLAARKSREKQAIKEKNTLEQLQDLEKKNQELNYEITQLQGVAKTLTAQIQEKRLALPTESPTLDIRLSDIDFENIFGLAPQTPRAIVNDPFLSDLAGWELPNSVADGHGEPNNLETSNYAPSTPSDFYRFFSELERKDELVADTPRELDSGLGFGNLGTKTA